MPPSKPRTFLSQLWELTRFILSVLLIVIPIRAFVAKPFIVSGASMYPTFKDSEYLIVDELSYYLRAPERGEVAIFKFPKDESKYFIKRIIGLPGETVIVKNNEVTIENMNGEKEKINEPYVKEDFESADTELTLGPGEYFVMGDNRNVSYDSRSWGAVTKDLIAGRAFVRLFPPSSVSLLPGAFTAK
jgi:signal peptidase I